MNLVDIFPSDGHRQTLYCDDCNKHLDLSFSYFREKISGVRVSIEGLPVLYCSPCKKSYLPDKSRFAIIYVHEQAVKNSSSVVNITRDRQKKDFNFSSVPFVYDSDDYEYIPGLKRPWNDGFLTPVNTTPQQEEKWYNKKVLKVGTKQIRDTLTYLKNNTSITLKNHRAHHFSLETSSIKKIHKLVVFKSDQALSKQLANKKCHISQTAGMIHIIPVEHYKGMIRTLITPTEFMEYLSYREALIKSWGKELDDVPEPVLVGHYIGGNENEKPELQHALYLQKINQDVNQWDITGIIHLYADRITDGGNLPTDYYEIISSLAKLDRNALRIFKQRYMLSIQKARANEFALPYRFSCPDLGLGFIFIPLTDEHINNQRNILSNLTEAHKYDQKLTQCIGMAFSKYGQEHYDVGWCCINEPWKHDSEIEEYLRDNPLLREVKSHTTSRY